MRVLILLLGGLVLATAFTLLAPVGWPFELFAHFRVQYAAIALLVGAGLLIARRPGLAALAVALVLYHAAPVVRYSAAGRPAAACTGPGFTVATVNVRYRNGDPRAVLEWLAAEAPDLVVVQELTPAWAEVLAQLPAYAHRKLLTRTDAYGIGVLSRWPFTRIDPVDLAGDRLPSLSAVVVVGDRPLAILGMHARWPIIPRLLHARDDALDRAARLVRAQSLPTVVLGDFNLTPLAPAFRRFEVEAGLRDAMGGAGWHPTWQAGFWPLALRIDHVFVPPSICVERASVGPAIGSDHRPVVARLGFDVDPR